jgi:predicted transcriptional regulator
LALLLAAILAVGTPGIARAGGDDFEYGRALAELGMKTGDQAYFDYARRIFQGVIGDENRSDAEKDLCRYGLAEMKVNEAMGATGNDSIMYDDVIKLFEEAVEGMEAFVKKNAGHKRFAEASLKVGTTRLGFVQWARDSLLSDPDYLLERGAKMDKVQADAGSMVRGAIQYFDGLRKGHDKMNASQMSQIAQYYWVLCQYYVALVAVPGTEDSKVAFENAAAALDEFITLNDGTLLAIYAQDILGLTRWEQAKQADGTDAKEQFYGRAVEWFEACIETEVETEDEERVVANGYYHIGQVCFEAGRVGSRNFHREGANFLKDMESRHGTIWRQDNGIRALFEWAKIENARDRQSEAIEITQRAGEYAKKLGKGWLEQRANKLLRIFISGTGGASGGGGSVSADPGVLMRVADDFFNEKKWGQAIAAYQRVLASSERTPENVDEFIIRAWERIASAYRSQGDLMASALALEPVHDIWVDDLVKKVGGKDDPNMIRLGDIRLRAQRAWQELHQKTGASIYRTQFTDIRDSFPTDYPKHPSSEIGLWNTARDKLNQAREQQRASNSRWRSTMKEADELYRRIAKDMNSQVQDAAWVKLMYTAYLRDDWKGILSVFEEADTFWNSKAAQAQAKAQPTIAARRKPEVGRASYWKAEALYRLERWDDVIKALDGWHVEYDSLKSSGPYYVGALGHLVFAYIGKGDIPNADKYFTRILEADANYRLLPKITFALAKHFNDQAREIDSERKKARIALNGSVEDPLGGARTKLRMVEKRESQTVGYLVTRQSRLVKLKELVDTYERKQKEGMPQNIRDEDYAAAKKEIPELTKQIGELSKSANELTAEMQSLQTQVADLTEKIKELAQKLYEPLTRAAGYFWEWDNALANNGLTRDPRNISIFADLYYKAGLLRPEVEGNWIRARKLYEDFLKMKGAEQADKQEAIGRLGTIYSRLAENAEQGTPARAGLVSKALDRLQSSLAYVPENNDLIVGLLSGDVVVIPFRKGTGPLNRFPLPRVKTVAEFKKAVDSLGKSGGPPIPKFLSEIDNKRYERAVMEFKVHVQGMTDTEIDRTVQGFENAGFDVGFFKEHAESGTEFRLALAWIYTESGVKEHMIKGYNLASSVASGRFAAEENSEDWWTAQVTRLRALVNGAELNLREAGAKSSPIANDWTRRASKMLRGLHTSSPDLGDDIRPGTRDHLKKLNQRIELLRGQVGLKPMNLLLDKLPDLRRPPVKDEKK